MPILSRCRALMALVCLSAAAFAAQPLTVAAQTSPGSVLFSRTMSGMVDGFNTPTGSAIFIVGDDGSQERQLTPYAIGAFNMPSVAAYENIWLTNAFNPSGTWSIYLQAQSALPHYQDTSYHGKYLIVNAYGLSTAPLFYSPDDLQSPSIGPSYGSVSWGPAGNDQIAYANVPDTLDGRHPACISLVHSDGSNRHPLWCAATWDYCGIEAIRWSGDGSSLLAYAVHSAQAGNPEADLYLINTTTGVATLVEANIRAPYVGWGVGDVSYDAHEVVYGVVYDTHDPGPCNVNSTTIIVWCAKNMLTGREVALTDPSNVVKFGFPGQVLISPDGSQAILSSDSERDEEIYAVKTDGSGLRKLTSPCVPVDANTTVQWNPVRVSPDGTRMLANCHTSEYPPYPIVTMDRIMVVGLTDGSARFVTNGVAYDWHATTP